MSSKETHSNSSAFKAYFSGKLSGEQKENFERDLADDDFEKEAFEGFESLENNDKVSKLIDEINNEVRVKSGLGKSYNSISFPFIKVLSAAAAVLVLLGFGFLINQQLKTTENTLVQNEDVPATERIDKIEENNFISEVADDGEFEDEAENEPMLNEDSKLVKTEKPAAIPSQEINVLEDAIIVESDAIEITTEPVLASKKATVEIEEVQSAAMLDSGNDMASSSMRAESTSSFDIAANLFKEKQYKAARNYYQKAIDSNQNKEDATYYLAMCNYHLQNNNKAKSTFDEIIAKRGLYSNNAKWFTSLILLEEGNVANAKILLKDLAVGNSGFKNQAADKLKELD